MDFLAELNERRTAYESELIMAKAKVLVINELIEHIARKQQETEGEFDQTENTELSHIDESY
jgi:hypothetical protein